jgi:hypothetical protein
MEKIIKQIKDYLKRGDDWLLTTSKHYCFLNLNKENNKITVRRWGMLGRPLGESAHYWIQLNLKDPKLDKRIETGLKKWADKTDLTFDPLKSGFPGRDSPKTNPFDLYR